MIVPMEQQHATDVGKLHHKYVPSLLTDLGERMCVIFYETVLRSDNNFGFVYIENSKVLGFIFGTTDNSRLFRYPRIMFAIGIRLINNLTVIKKIISRFQENVPSGPEVSFIAIDLEVRRKGIANQLILPLFEEYTKKNCSHVMNWIDADNKPSLSLSLSRGSQIIGEFNEGGKRRFILNSPVESVLEGLQKYIKKPQNKKGGRINGYSNAAQACNGNREAAP